MTKPIVYCTRSRRHTTPTFLIALTKGCPQTTVKRFGQEKLTLQVITAPDWKSANAYAQKWFGVGMYGERRG